MSKRIWVEKIKDLPIYISDGNYSSKYPSADEMMGEGVPFIRANNLDEDTVTMTDMRYITVEKHGELLKGHVQEDDVLICVRGDIGKTSIVPHKLNDANINAQLAFLRVTDKEKLNSRYLLHALRYDGFLRQVEQNQTGTALKQLPINKLKELEITLLNIEKQIRIASALDKAQEIVNKRKKQIAECEELIKSQFIEMFGDPINNPMGWEVKKLKDMSTKILSGNTPKGGSQVYVEEGITFFRSQNVWKNRLVLDDIAYIDQETHNSMSKSSLKHRDILMTKTGRINTENSSLGRAAMFLGEDDSANVNGHVYLIRLKENMVNEFVLFILTTNEYREYIRSVCVGGIDKRQINKEHLEEFPIIYPPIELQIKFATMVKQVDKLKFEMEQSLGELENNFNSLMQRAFKGELF